MLGNLHFMQDGAGGHVNVGHTVKYVITAIFLIFDVPKYAGK